ncbi:MAG: sugar ABC transporter permease [Anaerolineales bacterium]|nr:sugar ABC transporter permease [Anaerolineales bacterium]
MRTALPIALAIDVVCSVYYTSIRSFDTLYLPTDARKHVYMSSAFATGKPTTDTTRTQVQKQRGLFSGRQGRRLREALLAYLFLLPAFVIVGAFGLFPILFAAYQSTLRGVNKVVGTFDGLNNYIKAIDVLTYVLGFWGGVLLLYLAVRIVVQGRRQARARGEPFWRWLAPGLALGVTLLATLAWVIRLLPLLLSIPEQMRGARNTPENFRRLLGEALTTPEVMQALLIALGAFLFGIIVAILVHRTNRRRGLKGAYAGAFTGATALVGLAGLLLYLTWAELQTQTAKADATQTGLEIGSQFVMISAGFALLYLSWKLWQSASGRSSTVSTILRLGGAAMLLVGAWFLIAELPRVIGSGDKLWWYGLLATFYYAIGTVPLQLGIGLFLAVLLFQNIKGKSIFRMIFFCRLSRHLSARQPCLRSSSSSRPAAPVNEILGWFGLGPYLWLNEPQGILNLAGASFPIWLAGPSLALVVIMIYGIWTFFGFNTVVFLAGLGNIPKELHEAAAIDGAGRGAQFRHITLPLLSPTLYFLTLYSVIGTFKAFNHIYVLRTGAALGTTDTATIVIFQTFKRDTRYGYASALAILLLLIIIVFTVFNNRFAAKRVYYG